MLVVHYDVNKPIKLYCDASARRVCACLMHVVNEEEKPVLYALRTLSSAIVNYLPTCTLSVKHWQLFLG